MHMTGDNQVHIILVEQRLQTGSQMLCSRATILVSQIASQRRQFKSDDDRVSVKRLCSVDCKKGCEQALLTVRVSATLA